MLNNNTKNLIPVFTILSMFLIVFTFQPTEIFARKATTFDYVGVEMCKLCHKEKNLGNQYEIWTNTLHSKAYYLLDTPEARLAGDRVGVSEPQKSAKCLRCHSTAYAFSEKNIASDLELEDGVQCESCHGPGEEYMYPEVMGDRDDSKKKGLVMPPTIETCKKCHNQENPCWDPEKDTMPDGTKVNFYFPSRWEKIKHHKPENSGTK